MVVFRLFERYYIAHDALMLLTFVPCLIVFLCALCLARHRKDPARTAFSYLKAAFAFLTLLVAAPVFSCRLVAYRIVPCCAAYVKIKALSC